MIRLSRRSIAGAAFTWRSFMPKMTRARLFAEMMRGYGVSHIFFVPAFMLKAFAEMENMPIKRLMVHGEKAAAYMADGLHRRWRCRAAR
jgi:acetolactate synthase I/II/III large subunit